MYIGIQKYKVHEQTQPTLAQVQLLLLLLLTLKWVLSLLLMSL